jgi:two-component system KDP operon response regulator KdpE
MVSGEGMTKPQILIVDDELQIQKLLRIGLAGFGYSVTIVSNGEAALDEVMRRKPDIILLDINLGTSPDGLEIAQELREWTAIPIIMLTVNDHKKIKLAALNAGADDYLTKPFDMEELEARIRAVLRRTASSYSGTVEGVIRIHDLKIDMVKQRVLIKDEDVRLTPTEYKLLCALATQPGRVLTIKTLIQMIRGETQNPDAEHYIRVYINTLRKKLKDDTANRPRPLYIFSEPGVGYRFADVQPIE